MIPKSLRQQAGLEAGELHWLGERNKLRLFSAEGWALYREIEEAPNWRSLTPKSW